MKKLAIVLFVLAFASLAFSKSFYFDSADKVAKAMERLHVEVPKSSGFAAVAVSHGFASSFSSSFSSASSASASGGSGSGGGGVG